jgi:hypothetical protein
MSDVLKTLRENMNKELELVTNEIGSIQKALENLAVRQQQLKGACYALNLAQGELERKDAPPATEVPPAQEATPAPAVEAAPAAAPAEEGAPSGSPQST